MLRPDDWTGDLMQRILHECRVFAHPTFNLATQKELIMTFFDQVTESITKKFLTIFVQVLRQTAMLGRCRKPPMVHQEMLDLAKELLFRKGGHLEFHKNYERYLVIT